MEPMKKPTRVFAVQVPAGACTAAPLVGNRDKKSDNRQARMGKDHGKAVLVDELTESKRKGEEEAKDQMHSAKQLPQAAMNARRDDLVLEHLRLVRAIALSIHQNLPGHVDLDDLAQAGIIGLFDAASKFNSEKQVTFSSYAKYRIKGAILDSLRQIDVASRDLRRRNKQVDAVTRTLAAELQRDPNEEEIANKLGVAVDRFRQMMLDLRNSSLISASTRSNNQDDLPAPDFPSNPETRPDSMCSREQMRSALGTAMKTLPERYQNVVLLYYTNEMTMKEIGGLLGVNESRVSQIHKSALEKMQVVMQSNGISGVEAF